MKRLLEWKQRMLQSPLTRKGVPGVHALQTPPAVATPASALALSAAIEAGLGGAGGAAIQRRRSESHAAAGGYEANYSSDDEGEWWLYVEGVLLISMFALYVFKLDVRKNVFRRLLGFKLICAFVARSIANARRGFQRHKITFMLRIVYTFQYHLKHYLNCLVVFSQSRVEYART